MTYQIYKPSETLRSFVRFFWILEFESLEPGYCTQRIIPNGCVEVMFHFGDKVRKLLPDNTFETQPFALLSGQCTKFFDVMQTGKTGMISILFKPHAARMFFNIPINQITDLSIDLSYFAASQAFELSERIALAACNETRIAILEEFLINKLCDKNFYNFKRIGAAIDTINVNKGMVKVKELASVACLSSKQFDRVFYEFVGLHPKHFLKIVRLQSVFHHKKQFRHETLTELAYACGYYDQAHFVNDFKSFTGYTPAQCFAQCDSESDYFMDV